jgi:hypothetical protein
MATVRVRIAVVVDDKGGWNAAGWNSAGPQDDIGAARDGHNPDHEIVSERVHFVEADIPIPEPTTIEGTVTGPASGGGSVVPQCG